MRYSVEQCGCHLGIAKDRHPLPELQIGCDDDAGLLIKLTDEGVVARIGCQVLTQV